MLPESRDIHSLVMNFGVHGLGELTLIQKKTEGISKLHVNKGKNKITELRTILQRESQNS